MKILRLLALVMVVCCAVRGEELINRGDVLKQAAEITAQTYPNADQVIISDYTQVRYNADGTAVDVSENYTKILTEKAKRDNQSLSYNFTIPYTEITVDIVEIIKPDGSSVKIDVASQGREMVDRSQMSSNIYNPNDRVFQVSVTGLEKGDILHTYITTKTVKTRMVDSWSDYRVFEDMNPIKSVVYEVYAPNAKPLASIALKDEIPGTVTYTSTPHGDTTVHRWTATNVDRFYPEPDMPRYWTTVQRLLVSTNPDWATVSRWYWQLCEPRLTTDEAMKAKCDELISGITDKDEQIRAIFKFVSQDIRYLGITVEKDAPGYEPHDVTMTFANRHGVCRDKAALLVAMLRLADIKAYPVLIYSGPKKDEEVPQPFFNHAISAAVGEDGEFILMDSTDESTQRLLPAYLNDCSYLVATPDGAQLMTSPIDPASTNLMIINTAAEISAAGRYKAQSTMRFDGINDTAYRGFFLRSSPDQRRQYFEAVVKRLLPGARLTKFELKPDDLQDTSQTVTARIDYEADNVVIGGGDMAATSIYNIGDKVGMVNFILGKTGLEKRRFALETGFACGVSETYSLTLPDDMEVVSLPQYQTISDDCISWKRNIEQDGSVVKGESEFKIKVVRFEPPQYLALKQTLGDIEYNNAKKLICQKKEPATDVVVESLNTHYSLTDSGNWNTHFRVRQRVLTYKGKKDISELKFDYNPAWEEVNIVKASVETAGQIKLISEEEINVMDAAWAGSAPRYPASKTLVASLPGVEIGSVIEYEVQKISNDKPFFAVTEVFGGFYPITEKTVRLTLPKSIVCNIFKDDNGLLEPDGATTNIAEFTSETATMISYEWKAENLKAIKQETALPPLSGICPVIKISTGNWNDYIASIKKVIDRFELTREARLYPTKAAEITKYAVNDTDKIRMVRDFIAQNIRPVGVRFVEMPLTFITRPDITLTNGYGNYMDRAILTCAMLKSLNIEASIVLANESTRVEVFESFAAGLPDVSTFTKTLVKAVAEGKTYYIGDTDQYAAMGAVEADKYLSISLDEAKIERINAADDMLSRINNKYQIKVSEDGVVGLSAEEYSYGTYHGYANKNYAELTPEETRRYYLELIGQISQSAKAQSGLVTSFSEYPGSEKYSILMSRYAIVDGDYIYFELPGILPSVPEIREDARVLPYYSPGYMRYKTSVNIEIPAGFSPVLLPQSGTEHLPAGGYIKIASEVKGDSITLEYEVSLTPSVTMPQDCRALAEQFSWLKNRDKKFIMLQKKQ